MKKFKGLYSGSVIGAGILWGFTGLFVRWFSERGLSSMQVVVLRSFTASLILALFFLLTDRTKLKIRLKDLWLFLLISFCSVTVFNGCYFSSILLLNSMSVASVLLYTSPVFLTVLSAVFFKEKITKPKIAAVALTFAGCVLVSGITGKSVSFSASGVTLGICAGLTYALYSILAKLALCRKYHPLTIVFYMWFFGFLFTLPFGQASELISHIQKSPSEIGMYFLFGLVSAVLPYGLYTLGLQKVSAATAGVLATSEPCMASLIGVFFLGEPFGLPLCIGITAVVASVFLVNLSGKQKTAIYNEETK